MEKLNKIRFGNYAKWDFAINKKLYKNAAITIVSLFLGVTVIGFVGNYIASSCLGIAGFDYRMFEVGVFQVTGWLWNLMEWTISISAGFLFHNMLTKQGRIMELTTPATMEEKFWWHVLMNVGGAIALCIFTYLACDAIYAILTAIFVGPDAVTSLFCYYLHDYSFDEIFNVAITSKDVQNDINIINAVKEVFRPLFYIIPLFVIAKLTFSTGLFGFINSIKYKNNIPMTLLTFLIIIVIFVVIIIVFTASFILPRAMADCSSPEVESELAVSLLNAIFGFIYSLMGIEFIAGICLWIGTWKNYKKSQVITAGNK